MGAAFEVGRPERLSKPYGDRSDDRCRPVTATVETSSYDDFRMFTDGGGNEEALNCERGVDRAHLQAGLRWRLTSASGRRRLPTGPSMIGRDFTWAATRVTDGATTHLPVPWAVCRVGSLASNPSMFRR